MPFTIEDFHDLVRLLEERPDWRTELRRLVMTEGLLGLPARVEELAEAQARTEKQLEALTVRVSELAEAQVRTEKRLEALTVRVSELAEAQVRTEKRLNELAEAQARTEERLAELTEAQARTEERLAELAEAQGRTEERLAELAEAQGRTEERLDGAIDVLSRVLGYQLEWRYAQFGDSFFGAILRSVEVSKPGVMAQELENRLGEAEMQELLRADLVVRGVPRRRGEIGEVFLVLEVSAQVDSSDLERALRRAEILRQAGVRALPAVAGEGIAEAVARRAEQAHVVMLQDGKVMGWEEALTVWAT